MVKYTIEGGINFYEELYKSFDEPDVIETDDICQITGTPLIDRFITLECKHKFNYNAIYKEIYNQKCIFRTYNFSSLSQSDQDKFNDAKKDYFIKCPYCRNIQFTLLPYYEDLNLDKRYGINSLEKSKEDETYLINSNSYSLTPYTLNGYTFNKGACCKIKYTVDGKDVYCTSPFAAPVLEMNKSFCYIHIRAEVKQYKLAMIMKKKNEIKNEIKKKKEDLKSQQMKERADLKQEKALVKQKMADQKEELKKQKASKKVKNVVTSQTIEIQMFNSDDNTVNEGCPSILKSGPNKGHKCGNKGAKDANGYCLRHKIEPTQN